MTAGTVEGSSSRIVSNTAGTMDDLSLPNLLIAARTMEGEVTYSSRDFPYNVYLSLLILPDTAGIFDCSKNCPCNGKRQFYLQNGLAKKSKLYEGRSQPWAYTTTPPHVACSSPPKSIKRLIQ
jgi:hypothetical protein